MVSSYWQGGQRIEFAQCLFRFSAFMLPFGHVCAELRLHLHMSLMLILPCHQFLGRVFYPQIRQKLIALDLCKSVQKLHDLSTKDVSDKHWQRHNGPEGWVHLSKVTYWVISQVQTQILIKLHLQNLDQAFTSKSQPNITISTKLKIQNIDWT